MVNRQVGRAMGFGGPWTQEKLDVLERYLDAYTTALKDQVFKLVYLDVFAGTGEINVREYGVSDPDSDSFVMGSTERALRIQDRPFDRWVFVEKDSKRCSQLRRVRGQHPHLEIDIIEDDANLFLKALTRFEYGNWRGVLFVDPFGTEVEWATVEHIAGLHRLDLWLLFPVGAIGRMLPLSRNPDHVEPKWVDRLNIVFGGDHWRKLYSLSPQQNLFGDEVMERKPGVQRLLSIYKDQLKAAFETRFLEESRTLVNSRNSPLFEFIFCAGHPKGGPIAKRIARHLIRDISGTSSA